MNLAPLQFFLLACKLESPMAYNYTLFICKNVKLKQFIYMIVVYYNS